MGRIKFFHCYISKPLSIYLYLYIYIYLSIYLYILNLTFGVIVKFVHQQALWPLSAIKVCAGQWLALSHQQSYH